MSTAQHKPRSRRQRQLGLIHQGKKALGLDEDTYRDLLDRIAGRRSAADLDDPGRSAVISELRRLGFKPKRRRRDDQEILAEHKAKGAKPQEALVLSIWDELRHAGAVDADASIATFLERTVGRAVDHPRFLTPEESSKAIEGLRAWLARVRRSSS